MGDFNEPPEGGVGPRLVELSVCSLRHLPKMDRDGTCDAYIDISWLDHECRTTTRKNCYDPDFDEHLCFPINDSSSDIGPCSFSVKDWDMVGSENIGSVTLKKELMQRICAAPLGWEAEHTFPLKAPAPKRTLFRKRKKRAAVVGHDGQTCVLTLRVRVAELLDLREPPAGDSESSGGRRLELGVMSLRHLPKMDLLGSCDAYVEVNFMGHRVRTCTREASLNPDFHEHFGFSVPDVQSLMGPCELRVKDWDAMTDDDDIGMVVLDADLMARIAQAPVGWEGAHTFELIRVGPSCDPACPTAVVGQDGRRCELTICVRVAKLLSLDLCGVKALDLPQTDLLGGMSDPYCTVTVGPEEVGRSETVKRSLNPEFKWWWSHQQCSSKVCVEMAGTADLEPDSRSRCATRLVLKDWNRYTHDKNIGQPVALPHASLAGMWRAAPQRKTLELEVKTGFAGLFKSASKHGARLVVSVLTAAEKQRQAPAPAPATDDMSGAEDNKAAGRLRPSTNAAFGALAWHGGRRRGGWRPACTAARSGRARGLLPCGAGVASKEVRPESLASAAGERAHSGPTRGVDELTYVDAPVWRRGNGEVLVGRDVLPFVGMRVVMARQAVRWRYETGCTGNTPDHIGDLNGAGTIVRILAGSKRLEPSAGPTFARDCNSASVKVRWDATGSTFVLPVGLRGNFHLVPEADNPSRTPAESASSLRLADKEAAVEAEKAWEDARKKAAVLMTRQSAGGKLSREEQKFVETCVRRLEDEERAEAGKGDRCLVDAIASTRFMAC